MVTTGPSALTTTVVIELSFYMSPRCERNPGDRHVVGSSSIALAKGTGQSWGVKDILLQDVQQQAERP
jgi:hypothetical protein